MRQIRMLRAMRRELETGLRHTPTRARRGKPWIQPRSGLRVTAPVPDPTRRANATMFGWSRGARRAPTSSSRRISVTGATSTAATRTDFLVETDLFGAENPSDVILAKHRSRA